MRVFDALGRQLHSLANVADGDQLYVVPAGDVYVWPGGYVGRRLALPYARLPDGTPIALETVSLVPRAFFLPRFITDDEADAIKAAASDRLITSMGLDAGRSKVVAERTSRQAWLDCDKFPFVCELDQRIASTIRIPLRHVQRHSDSLQVVYYEKAQHYHAHHDWFDPTQHPDTPGFKEGYNRMLTLLFYLNDVPAGGGETVFPMSQQGTDPFRKGETIDFAECKRGLAVKPRRGAAILWYNMKAPGVGHEAVVDEYSLHGGCDPVEGEKWASNKWVYNHQWSAREHTETYYDPVPPLAVRPVVSGIDDDSMRIGGAERVRARDASIEKQIEFVNRAAAAVKVLWLNPSTAEQMLILDNLAPANSRPLNSFVGHTFVVRDMATDAELERHTVVDERFQYEIRGG